MINIIGIIIIIIVCIIVIALRKKVDKSNNTTLKTVMKVGDLFIWLRFLFVLIPLIILMLIAKKN